MTILWEFDEKHPRPVSAYGTQSWAKFSRPRSTSSGQALRASLTDVREFEEPVRRWGNRMSHLQVFAISKQRT
jgi:hypothetical protein